MSARERERSPQMLSETCHPLSTLGRAVEQLTLTSEFCKSLWKVDDMSSGAWKTIRRIADRSSGFPLLHRSKRQSIVPI